MSADISPLQTGARARRWGAWYVAEHKIRSMRGYIGTLVATAIGTPFLYLFAFGVGLATLITGNVGPVPGVTYLQFVASSSRPRGSVAMVRSASFSAEVERHLHGMNAPPSPGGRSSSVMLFVGLHILSQSTTRNAAFFDVFSWGAMTIVAGLLCGFAFSPVAATPRRSDRGQFAILQRDHPAADPVLERSSPDQLPISCSGSAGSPRSGTPASWAVSSSTARPNRSG